MKEIKKNTSNNWGKITYRKICYHCLKSKVFDIFIGPNKSEGWKNRFQTNDFKLEEGELHAQCRLCKNTVKLSPKVIEEVSDLLEYVIESPKNIKPDKMTTNYVGMICPNTLDFYHSDDGKMDRFINNGLMMLVIQKLGIRLNTGFILQREKIG